MLDTALKDRELQAEHEQSFRDLLTRLANESAALVRDEIDLAKQEIAEKIKAWRSGLIAIAAASMLGLLGLMSLCAAAIAGLAKVIGPALSALVIGVALAIIGGVVFRGALQHLKRTGLKPEQTIRTLREDKEWLKNVT